MQGKEWTGLHDVLSAQRRRYETPACLTGRGWGFGGCVGQIVTAKLYKGGEEKEVDVAVVKATNHDVCTPKEKHVRTILAATDGRRRREDVLYCLCQLAARLKSSHHLVVLKTLMVFHRLLRDGSDVAANQLQVRDLYLPPRMARLCTLYHPR
jgi:hypothetical protein